MIIFGYKVFAVCFRAMNTQKTLALRLKHAQEGYWAFNVRHLSTPIVLLSLGFLNNSLLSPFASFFPLGKFYSSVLAELVTMKCCRTVLQGLRNH